MTVKPQAPANRPPEWPSLCPAFVEHAPLPMATVEGATHMVRFANPAFCSLMDKPMEELIGKPLSELLPEKDQCVTLLDRVFRTGKPESHTEEEHSRAHPVFWSYTMWPVLADECVVGIIIQVTETAKFRGETVAMNEALLLGSVRQHELTDAADRLNAKLQLEITERKQAQQALTEAKAALADEAVHLERLVAERTAELTSTNQQLEAFVYTIAHDLRAPLRSMQGYSAVLVEEESAVMSQKGRDYAQRINKSAHFMDTMLADLLAFATISQQRVELVAVNLEPVVQATVSRLQKEIREKNARVEVLAPWPAVLAHEPTLSQVLFNLLGNALKFAAPGQPPVVCLRAEVVEAAERQSVAPPERGSGGASEREHAPNAPRSTLHVPAVRVWVEDNGIGIAPEYQEQIFRLFLCLNRDTYGGTGIGLAIVQKGVERMGGRVGVESAPGQGSRFWFELTMAKKTE